MATAETNSGFGKEARPRRRFHRSLYGKLALSFALIFALVGACELAIALTRYRALSDEITQKVNWELASSAVKRIQPLVLDAFDVDRITNELFALQQMSPRNELYLLDGNGNVLAFAAPDDFAVIDGPVDLGPLKRALSRDFPALPLYGPNPRERQREEKIFSVAPLRINGAPGYLYIILESLREEMILANAGDFFIIRSLLIGLAVMVFIGTGVAFTVFRYLTRSFRVLMDGIAQYGQGNFTHRVEISRDDEIGELAVAVNDMARRILDAERQQQELIAGISHDLRSPLTSMMGFVEMLRMPEIAAQPEKQKEYLEIIHRNLRAQERLANDLFEISKLRSREFLPDLETVELDGVIRQVTKRLQILAAEKTLELRTELPPAMPTVTADPVLIERVIANLVGNAIRYTPGGGRIVVGAKVIGSEIEVFVEDTGIGIPEKDLPFIFDTLYLVSKHRSRASGGSGFGLAIVKRILELHRSTVEVKSTEGVGSRFSFRLPAKR